MILLCRGDTVIDTLRNVFHANIVKIPESRIQPLVIAAAARDRTSFRGAILPLLRKPTGYTNPQVLESKMPSISGTKTRAVSLDLGLEVLGDSLQGFGVPSAGLSAAFQGAKKVSFSFDQVIRYFVDVNESGDDCAIWCWTEPTPLARSSFRKATRIDVASWIPRLPVAISRSAWRSRARTISTSTCRLSSKSSPRRKRACRSRRARI